MPISVLLFVLIAVLAIQAVTFFLREEARGKMGWICAAVASGLLLIGFLFIPNPLHMLGLRGLVIEDFGRMGWLPLPSFDPGSGVMIHIIVILSLACLIGGARALLTKAGDWLGLTVQVVLPGIVVFLLSISLHITRSSGADFSEIIELG